MTERADISSELVTRETTGIVTAGRFADVAGKRTEEIVGNTTDASVERGGSVTLGNCSSKVVGIEEMGPMIGEPIEEVGKAGMFTVVTPRDKAAEGI